MTTGRSAGQGTSDPRPADVTVPMAVTGPAEVTGPADRTPPDDTPTPPHGLPGGTDPRDTTKVLADALGALREAAASTRFASLLAASAAAPRAARARTGPGPSRPPRRCASACRPPG